MWLFLADVSERAKRVCMRALKGEREQEKKGFVRGTYEVRGWFRCRLVLRGSDWLIPEMERESA